MKSQIAIVGSGIIGLTCGIRLLEHGYQVTIFARDIQSHLASRAAGAIWSPYKASPVERVIAWAKQSLDVYQQYDARAGVEKMMINEYFKDANAEPLWLKILTHYDTLSSSQLPADYAKGFHYELFRIDTAVYVDHLIQHFSKLGGKIFQKTFQSLNEVTDEYKTIINCSGVWSHTLVPDHDIFPIRGQYLLIKKIAGIHKITFAEVDENSYILIIPRTHDCYLGGTTHNHDWSITVDPTTTATILSRAQMFEPLLQNADIIKSDIGLRPGRKSVRLEADKLVDGRQVIHNYGHGGSGFTIGWGCADDVVKMVD